MEALKAGRPLDTTYVVRGEQDKALRFIAQKGKAAGAVISEVDRRKLDAMSVTHAHQGVIAVAAVREYSTVADILALAAQRGEAPLVVVCDEISDPHNLGAIIRTAECAGAHGVVIPKRRSAGLTGVVATLMGVTFWLNGHVLAFVLPFIFLVFHFYTYLKMKRINRGRELNICLGEAARNILIYGLCVVIGLLV